MSNNKERASAATENPSNTDTGNTPTTNYTSDSSESTQTSSTDMLTLALGYAARGWRVFPVHPLKLGADGQPELNAHGGTICACKRGVTCKTKPGKHPAITGWDENATTRQDKITEWWTNWPNHNIGIATGHESNLLALDVDGPAGRESLVGLECPLGPCVSTGRSDGGVHHYFLCPDDFDARNFAGEIEGLDARANGGYVVAAGSRHQTGSRYVFVPGTENLEVPAPPEWLLEVLRRKNRPGGTSMVSDHGWYKINTLIEGVSPGGRDAAAVSLAGTLLKCQVPIETAYWHMDIFVANCEKIRLRTDPQRSQFTQAEGRAKVDYVWQKYVEDTEALTSFPLSDAGNAERFKRLWGSSTRFCIELSTWLHCDLPGFEGLWRPGSPKDLYTKLINTARTFQLAASQYKRNDNSNGVAEERRALMVYALRLENKDRYQAMELFARHELAISLDDHTPDPERLPCLNGVIDLRTGRLQPHDPAAFNIRYCPVEYHGQLDDEVLEKFLRGATAGVPGMEEALQERCGYYATGHTSEEEFDFFVGPGGAGKSTIAEALKSVLGAYSVSMRGEVFAKSDYATTGGHTDELMSIEGRRLAIIQEPEGGRRLKGELLKKLTGGDTLSGRVIYGSEREFQNNAKLVFVFNAAPELPAGDSGLARRLWVWPFNNGRDKQDRDPSVKNHLVHSPAGQSAVLGWVVEGAKRYLAATDHQVPQFVQARTKELWADMDSIKDFVADACVTGEDQKTRYTSLLKAYKRWCTDVERKPVPETDFRSWLDNNGYPSKKSNGQTRRIGIDLAPRDDEPEVDYEDAAGKFAAMLT